MSRYKNVRISDEWTIPGAEGEVIRGRSHAAVEKPRGVAIIAHGFKGYKDYGFLPALASHLAASLPIVAHRFDFSHSGMNEDTSTFGRPDLFEQDTYNKQVEDLDCLISAAHLGELPETVAASPIFLIGHSRGGVACLLTSGRRERDSKHPTPSGLVTLAAPSSPKPFSPQERSDLLEKGHLEVLSARTGQRLRVGKAFLQEQLDSSADFDLAALCGLIECPTLILHGKDDPTVPVDEAHKLGEFMEDASVVLIDGADHVFNTPNPADLDAEPSPQLARVCEEASALVGATLDQLAHV